jgi:outer membrane protein assembly factor BamB
VTAANRLWHVERATQRVGSGIIVGEHVYILNANGVAECIELKTGKTLWTERAGGSSWGSMVHADGKLYVTNQRGETVVLAAKPTFELLSTNPLGERSQSSPAISNGDIFIRTYQHLWCIGSTQQ